jgi:cobalt-precorrin 5A hydrolase/precorrin-3B C17-methyltransferase
MISPFKPFSPIAVIATTPKAIKTLHPLCQQIGANLHVPSHQTRLNNAQVYQGSLKDYLNSILGQNKVFIFRLETGSVVRLISHLLHNKSSDPAIFKG